MFLHAKQKIFSSSIIGIITAFFLLTSQVLLAATEEAHIVPSSQQVAVSSDVAVTVYVDSVQQINALDMQLTYPTKMLTFARVDTAKSIVSFWQGEPPLLSPGHVHLTGALLPAFMGTNGRVAVIHFTAIASGAATISFERTIVYLADGNATKVTTTTVPATLSIGNSIAGTPPVIPSESIDMTPPQLSVGIIKDPVSGNVLIAYTAHDTESGVTRVEMRAKQWGMWSDWRQIENPTLYPSTATSVEVRAINGSGLKTVQPLLSGSSSVMPMIMGGCMLLLFICILLYNKKRHEAKSL